VVSPAERRRAVTPSAGTDAMVDFFRTMAIGTTRVYVQRAGDADDGRAISKD
jgi:hypothetical protein